MRKKRTRFKLTTEELIEHRKFDAGATHSCPKCGNVFAIQSLKCPGCSELVRGSDSSMWSNFSSQTSNLSTDPSDSPTRPIQRSADSPERNDSDSNSKFTSAGGDDGAAELRAQMSVQRQIRAIRLFLLLAAFVLLFGMLHGASQRFDRLHSPDQSGTQ